MGLFFFKTPQHRVFNYKPLYYDERKEALDQKIEDARKRDAGEYVPGDTIRSGFKRLHFESKRHSTASQAQRLVTIVVAIIVLVAIWYFVDGIGLLFKSVQ